MNSHAKADDLTITEMVKHAIDSPTHMNILDAYNNIVRYRSLDKNSCNLSFDTIRQSLNDDEIAIELFALPKANGQILYVAFTVRSQYEAPHICILFNEDELNHEMGRGETIYTDTKLTTMFTEPLRQELYGVEKMYVTPAGRLHLFAIEYCNVEDGLMLGEKYEFYRLTSSAMLVSRKDKREPYSSYAIYGGIDFDVLPKFEERYEEGATKCRMGYLHDSYLAASDIYHFLNEKGLRGILYTNEKASEQSFKELPNHNIHLFLIETHGVVIPKAGNKYPNALMLAGSSYVMDGGIIPSGHEDGLLTYEEIAKLDLSTIDMAVISACKSALGDIDWKGVNGLMRGLKTAGVNSLIMTTDDVVDYVSGEVWRTFFQNVVSGMSKRESLLNAIKRIRTIHDGFYRSPKYWTPFILIDGID